MRQVCPEEVLTSAAGGSDSNRKSSVGGDELRKEHAATAKPHATKAMARLMTRIPPFEHAGASGPTRIALVRSPKVGRNCGGDEVNGHTSSGSKTSRSVYQCELHPMPTCQDSNAGYRIGGDQSGGVKALAQPERDCWPKVGYFRDGSKTAQKAPSAESLVLLREQP